MILDDHNKFRNIIAGGKTPKHPSASRMGTMTWDNNLAYLAGLNSKTCLFEHDECYTTSKYPYAGQNLAATSHNSKMPIKEMLQKQIASWYNEYKYSSINEIKKVPATSGPNAIGHFTVMVNEANIRVGCAAVKFLRFQKSDLYETVHLSCNYAMTNIVGGRVYTPGKPASGCKTGRNPKYPNLCSVKEKYDLIKPAPAVK